ncbi:MAG TPA: PIG-L family deacetylase [Steroidobacteraceae bacterium]|nr:PIG-L family deacetylase [Steroidobacteraceae bacterium]
MLMKARTVKHTTRVAGVILLALACHPAQADRDATAVQEPPSGRGAINAASPAVSALPAFGPATSLLVVAPHPDDESLCCAGVIQRVLAAGGRVSIVWITSGDASELDLIVVEKSLFVKPALLRDLALKRMQEARAAAAVLGVSPDRLYFLGYPDRGVLSIVTDNYATPYHSRFTDAASVPYTGALFPGHPYTGLSLERDFESVLDRVRPTLVLAPSPRDTHSDHRATGILTLRTLARHSQLARARYWIVHGGEGWPTPRGYQPERELGLPPRGKGLALAPFRLQPPEEQRKATALRTYRTQMEVMSSILLSYVRTTELFSAEPMPARVPEE